MNINLAEHYGMCFGVRDALRLTHDLAHSSRITVLGQLVHNPTVSAHLETLGVQHADLQKPGTASTDRVVITAHGAADSAKKAWKDAGHHVADTTCPLVRKAHRALECLVLGGYHPVVIGKPDHAEVRGLVTDFPEATVISRAEEIESIPQSDRIGVISQTTQPIDLVRNLVHQIEKRRPNTQVKFLDTVCQPTKNRQISLEILCQNNDTIVIVGGRNSNNTHQLVLSARANGRKAYHVEGPGDLKPHWFYKSKEVGVTAGTSTLDETVGNVVVRLRQIADEKSPEPPINPSPSGHSLRKNKESEIALTSESNVRP
tara:strand:+ start:31797 stop:32744 length:948 start_codon:yes stop_codon:yes gene_type:complete